MPFFSCCKNTQTEHAVAYHYSNTPEFEHTRMKLMDAIERLNKDYGNPKLHKRGKVYCVDYNTLLDNDPWLVVEIITTHLHDNQTKVDERVRIELKSVAELVQLVQKANAGSGHQQTTA
jgi:hypothetical protein